MQPILLNWMASNFSGWGIVGVNLFLYWANDSEVRPLMGGPFTESELAGVDPLKLIACREAIFASNQFQNELRRVHWNAELVEDEAKLSKESDELLDSKAGLSND